MLANKAVGNRNLKLPVGYWQTGFPAGVSFQYIIFHKDLIMVLTEI